MVAVNSPETQGRSDIRHVFFQSLESGFGLSALLEASTGLDGGLLGVAANVCCVTVVAHVGF